MAAIMATSSMLNVPNVDDTMEISSDAGRGDQDIDLDFMGSDYGGHQETDLMLDDAVSDRGDQQAETHDEDMMRDDEITYFDEEEMQDDVDATFVQETEDLDFAYDEHPPTEDTYFEPTATLNVDEQPVEDFRDQPEEDDTLVDYQALSTDAQVPGEQTSQVDETAFPAAAAAAAAVDDITHTEGATGPTEVVEQLEADIEQVEAEPAVHDNDATGEVDLIRQPQDGAIQDDYKKKEAHVEVIVSENAPAQSRHISSSPEREAETASAAFQATIHTDEKAVPTETPQAQDASQSLLTTAPIPHIQVCYAPDPENSSNQFTFDLFQSHEQQDPNSYLLRDSSVTSTTLKGFFMACRSVLDDDLKNDQVLELCIDELQLTIHEDSSQCKTSNLAQLVEVYNLLHRNTYNQDADELTIYLSIKDKLSRTLTKMYTYAAGGGRIDELNLYPGASNRSQRESGTHQGEGEDRLKTWEGQQEDQTYVDEDAEDAEKTANVEIAAEAGDPQTVKTAEAEEEQTGDHFAETVQSFNAAEEEDVQPQETYFEDAVGFDEEEKQEEATQLESVEGEEHEDVTEVAEEGDDGSSGTLTVQAESRPESTCGYSPSIGDEGEWLIDYDDEDPDVDASSQTAQAHEEATDEPPQTEEEHNDANSFAAGDEQTGAETYGFGEEGPAETYDENNYNTDNFNQEFDGAAEYTGDHHGDDQQEGAEQPEDQEWINDDTQYELDPIDQTQGSGTFQVPSSTDDDDDEDVINYNDDEEFTVDDAETQDTAAVQDPTPGSPLGKRSREEDEEGELDGSDQGTSPKRARLSPEVDEFGF